jgi:hypothetical protein
MTKLRAYLTMMMGAAALLVAAGCKDFFSVENPNVVVASAINPSLQATTLAQSALQDFAAAYGPYTVFGGIFSGELWSADVNATGNLFSTRNVDNTLTDGYLSSMSQSRVLADHVINTLLGTPQANSDNMATGYLVAGYSFLSLAEYFCNAAVDGGPLLTTAAMLDSAVAIFSNAITIATAVGDATGLQLKNAALVGRARAELFAGNRAAALADAQAVPAAFNYNLIYLSDPSNLTRLDNYVLYIYVNRGTRAVPPVFQGIKDPRMITYPPSKDNLLPMDGVTPMWTMAKYQGYAAPIRLASGIEAQYIAAEAQGTAAELALVQARLSANGQAAYGGPTDSVSVLVQFLTQRTYEFYVEGKHMGDLQRWPNNVPFQTPVGTAYRKANVPAYSNEVCWPLSIQEITNNPHLKP